MGKAPAPAFVGIDVAKRRLEVRLRPSGEGFALDYGEEEVAALAERLGRARPPPPWWCPKPPSSLGRAGRGGPAPRPPGSSGRR